MIYGEAINQPQTSLPCGLLKALEAAPAGSHRPSGLWVGMTVTFCCIYSVTLRGTLSSLQMGKLRPKGRNRDAGSHVGRGSGPEFSPSFGNCPNSLAASVLHQGLSRLEPEVQCMGRARACQDSRMGKGPGVGDRWEEGTRTDFLRVLCGLKILWEAGPCMPSVMPFLPGRQTPGTWSLTSPSAQAHARTLLLHCPGFTSLNTR